MNIVVPVKFVPDLVEELTIDTSGTALDSEWLRLILSEFDDHAIEQAILLKESGVGQVTVVAPESEEADEVFYMAAAKGADRLIEITGDFELDMRNSTLAGVLANVIKPLQPELILTGVQAHNDLDGCLGLRLAEILDMPYVGYVSGVAVKGDQAKVRKEYPGGLIAEMGVKLPAVLGIQAAEKPSRYVPVSKIRQIMKTATIEKVPVSEIESKGDPVVSRMFQPEAGEQATMIEGDVDEVADKLITIFREIGVI